MRLRRWGAVIALVAVFTGMTKPTAAAVPDADRVVVAARSFDGGLRVESHTTFTLDPDALIVRVRYEADLKNTLPNITQGNFINKRYFSSFGLPTVAEAVNVVATRNGAPMSVSVESTDTPAFSLWVADIAPNLFYPSSMHLTITYDIPALAPRSEGFTRINRAFATFPTFVVGDPGITSIEVLIPEDFAVEVVGDDLVKTERDDGLVSYSADAIADPDTWQAMFVARDDDELVLREVDLGEFDVLVQGWPNDPEWADFVAEQVGDGVPELESLIGSGWPAKHDIDVVETVAPYLYGYGGWYRPSDSLVEVGDRLESRIILHELGHVWFNDDLFAGRWISEGFAEDASARVMAALDADVPAPAEVRADDPGALRLNVWSDPELQDGQSAEQERYGYNTSWSVIDRLADEIGADKMRALLRIALADELPYVADTAPGIMTRRADWRTLLDLFEEVGDSALAEELFRDLVVTPEEALRLDERSAARVEYAALVGAGDGWAPPRVIRSDMTDWHFEDALGGLDHALAVLEMRDDLATDLASIDEPMPRAFQETYEGARDLDDLSAYADVILAAGGALRSAREAKDHGAGPIGAVGLLLSDVDDDLDAAHTAFQAGDLDSALEHSAAVSDAMDGAVTAGIFRLLVALAIGLALAALLRFLRRRARSGRRQEASTEEDLMLLPGPVGSAPVTLLGAEPPMPSEPSAVAVEARIDDAEG